MRGQTKIIDDLLDMSRIRTGKFSLNLAPLDLNGMVENVVEVARVDASSSGLDIRFHCSTEPVLVHADATRLEQVVWNLLSNAIKFTPEGGTISVSVSVVDGSAKLVVKGDGQGIDPDFLPRIFDMFGQAPGRALHGRAGLGIGLSLVRQLVTRHGGRVTASSPDVGKGATFIVSLPVFELMERSTQKSLGHDTGPQLAGLKLLVVEDAQDAAIAMAKLLEMEGASVVVAGDGREALQRLDEAPFDMVLSDIGMPGMDGYELVAAIRKSDRFAELPVVALTGFGRESDADRATDAGFNAHLSKPVAIDELIELFRKLRAPTTDA